MTLVGKSGSGFSSGTFGFSSVLPLDPKSHFFQFRSSLSGDHQTVRVLSLVWVASISAIWSHRNNVIFRDEEVAVDRIFDLVQYRS